MTEPVLHTVRIADPAHHRVAVESRFPAGAPREVLMPVWTPGSYLVREYARHVEKLDAVADDGSPLPVGKTRKNRWRVDAAPGSPFTLRYVLYCHELTVRTNFVDPDFALLQGAATFLAGVGDLARPHRLRVVAPADWPTFACALARDNGDLVAPDFDAMIDAPLYAGRARPRRFTAGGREHTLVTEGGDGLWDEERAQRDCAAIVEALHRLWGFLPYRRYTLINLLATGRPGGLEHADSSVLVGDRHAVRTRKGYLAWLSLLAHEMFHAWNVKRLRPRALGPFDYENENHTPSLWIAEGITSYYDDLLVYRAGLESRKEYLAALAKHLADLEEVPGRAVQALRDASFDAWIKYYRQDENSVNSAVSYYLKGTAVALLLDVRIRQETAGRASLDTVMRLAYDRWSGGAGFDEEEFRAAAEEVAGVDLSSFFEQAVDSTAELDVDAALAWLGLRRRTKPPREGEETPAFLGVKTKVEDGRLWVSEVRRGTPAWEAGIAAGDELVALAGYCVPAGSWEERLRAFKPGEEAELLVARRDRLQTLRVTLAAPPERWKLEPDPAADDETKARLHSWLEGDATASDGETA